LRHEQHHSLQQMHDDRITAVVHEPSRLTLGMRQVLEAVDDDEAEVYYAQ
jgi:hypothetical protein